MIKTKRDRFIDKFCLPIFYWFVKEQGEEEKNASDLITKMELFGSDAKGLYMLNSELAGRTYYRKMDILPISRKKNLATFL